MEPLYLARSVPNHHGGLSQSYSDHSEASEEREEGQEETPRSSGVRIQEEGAGWAVAEAAIALWQHALTQWSETHTRTHTLETVRFEHIYVRFSTRYPKPILWRNPGNSFNRTHMFFCCLSHIIMSYDLIASIPAQCTDTDVWFFLL